MRFPGIDEHRAQHERRKPATECSACAGAPSRVVLVVEDDYVVRSDILAQFQAQGWSVLDAATGEAALALLTDHRIDVVFTERCSGLRSGLAHCEYRYDLTDALTVPDALESALRKLPWATVDP